jgi:hypothetical protein
MKANNIYHNFDIRKMHTTIYSLGRPQQSISKLTHVELSLT